MVSSTVARSQTVINLYRTEILFQQTLVPQQCRYAALENHILLWWDQKCKSKPNWHIYTSIAEV